MAIVTASYTNSAVFFNNNASDRSFRNVNTTITLPSNWNPNRNLVYGWSAGGCGGMGDSGQTSTPTYYKTSGGGGGSGAFFALANLNVAPGTQFDLQLPAKARGFTSTSATGTTDFNSTNDSQTIVFRQASSFELFNSDLGFFLQMSSGGNGASGWRFTNVGGAGGEIVNFPNSSFTDFFVYWPGSRGGNGRIDSGDTTAVAFRDWMSGGSGAGAPGPQSQGGAGTQGWESDGSFFGNNRGTGGGAGNFNESGISSRDFYPGAGVNNEGSPDWAVRGSQAADGGFARAGGSALPQQWGTQGLRPFVEAAWNPFNPFGIERFANFNSRMTTNLSGTSFTASSTYHSLGPGGGGQGTSGGTGGQGGDCGGGGGGGGTNLNSSFCSPGGVGGRSGIFFIWETDDHTNFNFCM